MKVKELVPGVVGVAVARVRRGVLVSLGVTVVWILLPWGGSIVMVYWAPSAPGNFINILPG